MDSGQLHVRKYIVCLNILHRSVPPTVENYRIRTQATRRKTVVGLSVIYSEI